MAQFTSVENLSQGMTFPDIFSSDPLQTENGSFSFDSRILGAYILVILAISIIFYYINPKFLQGENNKIDRLKLIAFSTIISFPIVCAFEYYS